MNATVAYDDAVDLLEADHQAVKKMFIDYGALCDDAAPATDKRALAQRICQALTVHAQIEEEIFYPAVLSAVLSSARDAHPLPKTLAELNTLKALMGQIEAVEPHGRLYDAKVKVLSAYVKRRIKDTHHSVFPMVRASSLDLCALGARIAARKAVLLAGRA